LARRDGTRDVEVTVSAVWALGYAHAHDGPLSNCHKSPRDLFPIDVRLPQGGDDPFHSRQVTRETELLTESNGSTERAAFKNQDVVA
jgi:hypothetical protein